MEKDKIPYIVIDTRGKGETNIECESICKDDLQETLLKVLKECMEYHEFEFVDEEKLFEVEESIKSGKSLEELESEKNLECDECGCQVILKKYITIINEVKYCGACKPNNPINKGVYDRFQKFLNKKGGVNEIWYFEDGDWVKFTIE
jgi:DNA-directed RNA polymerase subunit RPC12/RpoP